MGKTSKILVCGARNSGKTSLLEQLLYGRFKTLQQSPQNFPTIEDTYDAEIELLHGVKEQLRFFDTAGAAEDSSYLPLDYYCAVVDAYVLVYSITDGQSFSRIHSMKQDIDRLKEKRELVMIAIGNKADLHAERQVDLCVAQAWGNREKVRVFEVTAKDRRTLMEPFLYLSTRLNPPQNKTSILGRKKPAQGNLEM